MNPRRKTRKKSAKTKKMECGHVAPSCARRCAGSRLPDHARCSFFVRSRHRARVRPRRSIHLPAGSMWRAHQHSHKHVWPRTTFNKGGHETIRQRGRHRQRIFYATHDVSVHLTQPRARLWARSASGQQHAFCQHVPSMPPMPCHACHAAPHLAAPCCAGAARPLLRFVQDAAISRCSPGPPGRLRLRCMCVCVLGMVMFQCRPMCFLPSGRLPFAVRLFLLSVGLAIAFVFGFG